MKNIITSAALIVASASAISTSSGNPKVVSPGNMTYTAGSEVKVRWDPEGVRTGFVNIDLVNSNDQVLQFPMMIAHAVKTETGEYTWKVPGELKTSAGYKLRVWGVNQPERSETGEGISSQFTVFNDLKGAINTFVVVTPNKEKPCAAGTTCKITWDYPASANYPAMVDIRLFRLGEATELLHIATVSSSDKSYEWSVPNDGSLIGNDVYLSVSGQGIPMAGPGMGTDMGGNSGAFVVAPQPAPVVSSTAVSKTSSSKKVSKVSSPTSISGQAKKNSAAASTDIKSAALILAALLAVPLFMLL